MTDTDITTRHYRLQPIAVPGFSGPLDLLLSLIEEGAFDVGRVSLADVTDQYLVRIKAMKDLPPEHLADFLVVAATLLLLKSKMMFPDLQLTEEEEEKVASLEEQLREYQRFRAAAKGFLRRWGRRVLYGREAFLGIPPTFFPPTGMDAAALARAASTVVAHLPALTVMAQEVVQRVLSIEEQIRGIQSRIAERMSLTFDEIARSHASKVGIIVSFLALLELVKQRLVTVEQGEAFRDILIHRRPHDEEPHA